VTAYIAISIRKKEALRQELAAIADTLNRFQIQPFVFVDNYMFHSYQERQMMQQALKDIDRCDLMIAETSDKAIGVGIEAGYAKAKKKPVVYIRHHDAEHSTTVAGISDFQIVYNDAADLTTQLSEILKQLSQRQIQTSITNLVETFTITNYKG
jgi:2'-deoxynucleoside 5'-phosphate N-hydrolase